MMGLEWFIRLRQWVKNPPSRKMIWIAAVTVSLVLALAYAEHLGLVPQDLRPQSRTLPPITK